MRFAASISEHPDAATATGEVVGAVAERVPPAPGLAVLFVSEHHRDALADIVSVVRRVLAPGALIGAVAGSVLGPHREVESEPAISLWAGALPGVETISLDIGESDDGPVLLGLPATAAPATMLLLADPFSFPTTAVLELLAVAHPEITVVGGMASAGDAPGRNQLVVDDQVRDQGAVGVLIPASTGVRAVVSQGCRPIGSPLTVTRVTGNHLEEIAGRPAVERLQEALDDLDEDELTSARHGLHLGRIIDQHKIEVGPGDFLISDVLRGDTTTGTLTVRDAISIGDTVQFQVRDAASASRDLHDVLAPHRAEAALDFTCNGRGIRLFGVPDHDVEAVSDALDTETVAGMSCAGEVGPVGPRSFLHGFTASMALFSDRPLPPLR